jgi:stage V sporulation protein AA
MSSVTVYIKPEKNTEVYTERVSLGQVAEVFCQETDIENRCKAITLLHIHEKKDQTFACSSMDVVKKIHEISSQIQVVNLGEIDFLIGYRVKKRSIDTKEKWKAAAVGIIVFFGAAFAIMTFNRDGDVADIFQQIYQLIMGKPAQGTTVLEIGYSLGLMIGVILFFNHIGKHKLSMDPTPIEVQMRLYEDEVSTTLIQNASRKEAGVDPDAPPKVSDLNQGG